MEKALHREHQAGPGCPEPLSRKHEGEAALPTPASSYLVRPALSVPCAAPEQCTPDLSPSPLQSFPGAPASLSSQTTTNKLTTRTNLGQAPHLGTGTHLPQT